MTKRVTIWFTASMSSMFVCGGLAGAFGSHPTWWKDGADLFGVLAALSFVALIGTVLGITVVSLALNAYVRHTGSPVIGGVVHARPAGYVNRVPNWELELLLPDGRTGRMQVARFGSFSPGEALEVIAGKGDPARTVLPTSSWKRPSF